MSTSQPTRAPIQLEKLSSEGLLESYCHSKEEIPILSLWERLTDRNDSKSIFSELKRKSQYICPPGYDPNWIFLGSFTRAYFRFKKYACNYRGRLGTPAFEAFKRWVIKCSIIDEYRFAKGGGKGKFEQLGDLDFIDDSGQIIKTGRKEHIELWEEVDRARQEDEERLLAEEGANEEEDVQQQ